LENLEIARLLAETADLMEIAQEDPFRIRSYRNGASTIEGYPERLADLVNDPARTLTGIPGIGKSLAHAIEEIVQRGSFERRDLLLEKYPPTALELLRIQGLGPKSIRLIWDHFRVSTVDGLEKLCLERRLQTLPRMGAKLEEKVLRSISQYRQSQGRYLLSFAAQVAEELELVLREVDGVDRVTPAGSLRRGKETVGDLDILVTGQGAPAALDRFLHHPRIVAVLASGPSKASGLFGLERIQVDVKAVPEASYGSAMQYFTGSKEHNIVIRSRAQRMGLTLNEYGLAKVDGGERIASETEEDVYRTLGLDWIPPELRENQGEIEAAVEGRLPRLIEPGDIRGDLHMHTRESDGRASLEEMAEAARSLGYDYIAVTDHSKALAMANGLDETRAVAFAAAVRAYNREGHGIRVFSGLECDIQRDGSMDLGEEALAELDYVIGSVHSHMNLEPAEMTDRLLRALDSPNVRAVGHPTGRLLLHREGFGFDFERVATKAAARGIWMEINASPERLDLSATLIRLAKGRGVRFVISTDAHHPKHLRNMRFGVTMARRGWLERGDVINTQSLGDLEKALKR
jgi:DNA polymerase (family 10)